MKTVESYTNRITPAHSSKARFFATVKETVSPFALGQGALERIPEKFDLDSAVGAQLDVVGEWIGRSRFIPIPVADPWFRFGSERKGWGRGIWRGPYSMGESLERLDDDTYRKLLRAKILSNKWDGTPQGAEGALKEFFGSDFPLFVCDSSRSVGWTKAKKPQVDSVNMNWLLLIPKASPTKVNLQILDKQLIPCKPVGVGMSVRISSVSGAPLFGFGRSDDRISGWGSGSWGVSPSQLSNLI